MIPDDDARKIVDAITWQELCLGIKIKDESRQKYVKIIEDLAAKGIMDPEIKTKKRGEVKL